MEQVVLIFSFFKFYINRYKMVVMKYTSKEIREKYKITIQTLYNWRNLDKIKFEKLPSGSYMYTDPLEQTEVESRKNVIYARVSNTKQKERLCVAANKKFSTG